MLNKDRKGQLALRIGNEHNEPCVVYVAGINSMDFLILRKINTGETQFEDPDADTLIDFDFKAYEISRAQWRLDQAKRSIDQRQKDLNETLQKYGKAQEPGHE